MSKQLSFLCISGSLRQQSYNTMALRVLKDLAPAHLALTMADWTGVPIYDADVQAKGIPAIVTKLGEQVAKADAVIFSTPEYNYSVPGGLKNALDWLSRLNPQPFNDKPVGIMGASMGPIATARAQYDLRKIMVFLNAHCLNKPEIMIGLAQTKFDADGTLKDDVTRDFLAQFLTALEAWTVRLKA